MYERSVPQTSSRPQTQTQSLYLAAIAEQVAQGRRAAQMGLTPAPTWTEAQVAGWTMETGGK